MLVLSVLIDQNGYILVFFNTHLMDEKPLFMMKSKRPEDITSWSEVTELFLNDSIVVTAVL